MRAEGTSRRAVFNSLDWMRDLPEPSNADTTTMLTTLLAYQLDRQSSGDTQASAPALAQRLAALCAAQKGVPAAEQNPNHALKKKTRLNWLANFMAVAEFLARETRTGATPSNSPQPTEPPNERRHPRPATPLY